MRPGATYNAIATNSWQSLPQLIGVDLPAATVQVMITSTGPFSWCMITAPASGHNGIEQTSGSITIAGSEQIRNMRIKSSTGVTLALQTWQS